MSEEKVAVVTQEKQKKLHRKWVDDIPLYLMAAPGVLFLFLFHYVPMIGLIMAFQKMDLAKGVFSSPWYGLKNFEYLFTSSYGWIITRNTVGYNFVFIIVNMFLSILLALLLSEIRSRGLAKVLQTIFIMPHFLSYSIVAIIVLAFINATYGFVTLLIKNMTGKAINFYLVEGPWPYLFVIINAWKGVGYSAIVYLAAISGISQEYYEAAMLDGATKFQQAIYITIPQLRTMMTILLIMSIGSIFVGNFGLFYNCTQNTGAIYNVTQVIDTFVYRAMTQLSNYGMATAAGLYQSVVGCILVLLSNWIVTKIDADSALF